MTTGSPVPRYLLSSSYQARWTCHKCSTDIRISYLLSRSRSIMAKYKGRRPSRSATVRRSLISVYWHRSDVTGAGVGRRGSTKADIIAGTIRLWSIGLCLLRVLQRAVIKAYVIIGTKLRPRSIELTQHAEAVYLLPRILCVRPCPTSRLHSSCSFVGSCLQMRSQTQGHQSWVRHL